MFERSKNTGWRMQYIKISTVNQRTGLIVSGRVSPETRKVNGLLGDRQTIHCLGDVF